MAELLARKREATSINFQLGAFDLET